MSSRAFVAAVGLWFGLSAHSAAAQQPAALTVVQSGPTNEIQNLREANEIRIVFSEPMVALGRIPDPVTAPFVTIRPAIAGTYRWSGTTILIFTPDPSRKLPNATQYEVTVNTSAAAVSGRRLATPYRFTFTTPTVKLLRLDWYRKNKRYDSTMVLALQVQPACASRRHRLAHDAEIRTAPVRCPGAFECRAGAAQNQRSAGDSAL